MKPSMVPLFAAVTVASAFAGVQALTPSQAAQQAKTILNAKRASLALILYKSDWNDVFPPATSTAQAVRAVTPYLKSVQDWKTENPGARLLFNTNLAGVSTQAIPAPGDVPLLYESKAWPDGRRVVGYVDRRVRAEAGPRWPAIEKMLNKSWPKAKSRKKGS